jgi:ubiquinone/menaquinone biosynthesis C-methylase UbiE
MPRAEAGLRAQIERPVALEPDGANGMTRRMLSHAEAKIFYDRLGPKQDLQVYERRAIDVLVESSRFEDASAVVELGCGTGALAQRLLRQRLPTTATYLGLDVSTAMVRLARERVRDWPDRARIVQTDGTLALPVENRSCDRVVSAYVLDLLGDEDIRTAIAEALRALVPGGMLCLVSLTFGQTAISRGVGVLWDSVHRIRPGLVGGCRPLRLEEYVSRDWEIRQLRTVCQLGICSEVVVARSPGSPVAVVTRAG